MSTPQGDPARDEVSTPTVRTGPPGGTVAPAGRRWTWGAIPDHLGRARTSTLVLSVLFLAIGTLYLNVRPDEQPPGTATTGGTSDVQTPVIPPRPTVTPRPEPTPEPVPTSGPDEDTHAPTTTTAVPTTSPSGTTPEPTGPTGTPVPTDGTLLPETSTPSSTPSP
jgi:hypothetical protein